MNDLAPSRTRVGFALAAVAATMIAVVFLVLGDGVDSTAAGWRGPVLEFGHAAVWLGLAVAAVRQRWTRASSVLCGVAGVGYLAFLTTLFTT